MYKRQKKMTAMENYQNYTDRQKRFHRLPTVNGKQMVHQKLKTEKQRNYIHTNILAL